MKYKTNLVGTSKNMQIYSELGHAAKKRKKLTGYYYTGVAAMGPKLYIHYQSIELGYLEDGIIVNAIQFASQHNKKTFFKLVGYYPWAHDNCCYWVEVYNKAIEILDNGRMICRFNDGTYVERVESEPIVFVDEKKVIDHAILDAVNKTIKHKV